MLLKQLIQRVENCKEFADYKKKRPNSYLAHVFFMENKPMQVGYYDKDTGNIATFEEDTEGKDAFNIQESLPFKEDNADIKKLDISKVKIDMDVAIDAALNVKKEAYNHEVICKQVIILQNFRFGKGFRQIYNITFITMSFKTLNIKIDAANKKILSHDLASLLGL